MQQSSTVKKVRVSGHVGFQEKLAVYQKSKDGT